MNNRFFTVVLPLDESSRHMIEREPNLSALRATIWGQAAKCMTALLGKTCSAFSPAILSAPLPYGVAFGKTEPHDFLTCYLAAREIQEAEIDARNRRIRDRGRPIFSKQLDEHTSAVLMAFNRDDPELYQELELGNRFFCGDITAAASLYYLGPNKCYIEERQENEILSQLEKYAICVARLQPLEV